MKIDYQDRIDEYLLHRMSDEERIAFENEVDSDKELQEQLSFTEDVQQTLKSRNEKLSKMEEWQGDYEWEETRSKPWSSSRKFFYWVSGIAAIFIAGFFFAHIYMSDNFDVVYYKETPALGNVTFRGSSNYSHIDTLLCNSEYEEALSKIEREEFILRSDSVRIIQKKEMHEKQKEYMMQRVKMQKDDLNWLKVHALWGLHRQAEAISLLNSIRHTENEYKEQADSLYHLLRQ